MPDWSQAQVGAAVVAGVVALVTAIVTALVTISISERKLRRDFGLEFAAEQVTRELMQSEWPLRPFNVIKIHLGGFEDDELRKMLVKAGAIRFESKSGFELWGLLARNRHLLGVTQVSSDPTNPRTALPSWVTPAKISETT